MSSIMKKKKSNLNDYLKMLSEKFFKEKKFFPIFYIASFVILASVIIGVIMLFNSPKQETATQGVSQSNQQAQSDTANNNSQVIDYKNNDPDMKKVNEIVIEAENPQSVKGKILIDGSSIAGQISQLVADKFNTVYKNVFVDVGVSGTTEGIEKFVSGQIDICETTREMTPEESSLASKKGISYDKYKLGFDGIAIVASNSNSFVKAISLTEIRKLWDSKTKARKFSDVNPAWPSAPIMLFSVNADAINFSSAVFGSSNEFSRGNTEVEDGKSLIESLNANPNSLAFCGYDIYKANQSKLKAIKIITGSGEVLPTDETIKNGTYNPLGRTLYLYVSKKSMQKDYVKSFVKVYIENAKTFVKASKFLPVSDSEYQAYLSKL